MNRQINAFFLSLLLLALPHVLFAASNDHNDADNHNHAGANSEPGHKDEHEDAGHEEAALKMSAEQRQAKGIASAKVAARSQGEEITAPGEVKMNAYTSAKVTPRIAAQIAKRYVRLGDIVKKGTRLVTLSSTDMSQAQGELILAEREWRRVQSLGKELASERRFTEASVARQLAAAKVQAYGMSAAQVEQLLSKDDPSLANGTFDLLAPRSGRIVKDDFIEGEVAAPGQVLLEITDESVMWVQIRLSPQQASSVKAGTAVRLQVGDKWLLGKVTQPGHSLDEETRTIPVRAEIANTGDVLHPGQFVEVKLQTGGMAPVLAVPAEAIVIIQGVPTVFKAEKDELHPQPIETGNTKGGWTEVRAGLAAGDEIIVKGVFLLKSLMLKSQLGEGHAH